MLTKKMQYQAMVDRMAGLETPFQPDDFEGYLRLCWQALDRARPGQEMQAVFETPGTDDERMQLLENLRRMRPGETHGRLPTMAELAESIPPIRWVWQGWIPRGMITLLGAAPGSGKSLVALDLAWRIIHATSFPDGQPVESKEGAVIYVDAEVALPLHKQRAENWGMNTNRLFMKVPERGGAIDLFNLTQREQLFEEVACNRPELVVIDALGNASSRGENDVEEVRGMLMYLNQLAQDLQVGLLLIHHTRKGMGMRGRSSEFTMDDIRGSGHIIAMSRSVLGLSIIQVGEKFDPGGPRRMEVLKTNLGAYPKPLGLELVKQEQGVFLEWGEVAQPFEKPNSLPSCVTWLEALMRKEGTIRPGKALALAIEAGFSKNMVYKAREALAGRLVADRPKYDPETKWVWLGSKLPDNPLPGDKLPSNKLPSNRLPESQQPENHLRESPPQELPESA